MQQALRFAHLPAVKSCDKNLPRFTIAPVTYSRLHVRMLSLEILFLVVRKYVQYYAMHASNFPKGITINILTNKPSRLRRSSRNRKSTFHPKTYALYYNRIFSISTLANNLLVLILLCTESLFFFVQENFKKSSADLLSIYSLVNTNVKVQLF